MSHASKARATHSKVPFARQGNRVADLADSAASWVPAEEDERFTEAVAAVLASSPDAADVLRVEPMGSPAAARHLIDSVPDWAMSRLPGWWELLVVGSDVAGFVMPVIYDQCSRDALDEATIFHMGVVPGHRGRGYGRTLLRRATQTLVAHGVWRVYVDTAANNEAMLHLLESEGWSRLPPHERPLDVTS